MLGSDVAVLKSKGDALQKSLNSTQKSIEFNRLVADGALKEPLADLYANGTEKKPKAKWPMHLHMYKEVLGGVDKKMSDALQNNTFGTLLNKSKVLKKVQENALRLAGNGAVTKDHVAQALKDTFDSHNGTSYVQRNANREVADTFLGASVQNGKWVPDNDTVINNTNRSIDGWYDELGKQGKQNEISKDDIAWLKDQYNTAKSTPTPSKFPNDLQLDDNFLNGQLNTIRDNVSKNKDNNQIQLQVWQKSLIGSDLVMRENWAETDPSTAGKSPQLNAQTKLTTNAQRELDITQIGFFNAHIFREAIAKRHQFQAENSPKERALKRDLEQLPMIKDFVNSGSKRGTIPDLGLGKVATPSEFMQTWIDKNDLRSSIKTPDQGKGAIDTMDEFLKLERDLEELTGGRSVRTVGDLAFVDPVKLASIQERADKLREVGCDRLVGVAKQLEAAAFNRNDLDGYQASSTSSAANALGYTADAMAKRLGAIGRMIDGAKNESELRKFNQLPFLNNLRSDYEPADDAEEMASPSQMLAEMAESSVFPKMGDDGPQKPWVQASRVFDEFGVFVDQHGTRLSELEQRDLDNDLDKTEQQELSGLRSQLSELQKGVDKFLDEQERLENNLDLKDLDRVGQTVIFSAKQEALRLKEVLAGRTEEREEQYDLGGDDEVMQQKKKGMFDRFKGWVGRGDNNEVRTHTFPRAYPKLDINTNALERDAGFVDELGKKMGGNEYALVDADAIMDATDMLQQCSHGLHMQIQDMPVLAEDRNGKAEQRAILGLNKNRVMIDGARKDLQSLRESVTNSNNLPASGPNDTRTDDIKRADYLQRIDDLDAHLAKVETGLAQTSSAMTDYLNTGVQGREAYVKFKAELDD